jgi:chemotaxis protein methyltransferase CheR
MSRALEAGPNLPDEEFRLLRDLVNRFCGIHFSDDAQFIVARRLRDRLRLLHMRDFTQYYQYLRHHPDGEAELENAVDALTTNETYFFREDYQLRAFANEVLPDLRSRALARGSKTLALWSAGCSTAGTSASSATTSPAVCSRRRARRCTANRASGRCRPSTTPISSPYRVAVRYTPKYEPCATSGT